jgi:hypothetical protein
MMAKKVRPFFPKPDGRHDCKKSRACYRREKAESIEARDNSYLI